MCRFDLHTHTCFSDGSLSPKQLCDKALEMGLSGLSITDHDTCEAYKHLPKSPLKIGFGVEFSSFVDKESVHVLCYDYILGHPAIQQLCQRHKTRRIHRNRAILANLAKLGIPLSEETLYSQFSAHSVGRPHIAQMMIEKGYITSMDQAFKLYLGDAGKAYDPGEMISLDETLDTIHQAEGKAFLAHPHVIKRKKLVRTLLTKPFDGIEAYYARNPKEFNDPWVEIAHQKKWLISGGSDFHGDLKTFNQLGSAWVDQLQFDKIFQRPISLV